MKHAVSRDLYDYWNVARAGRAAPERCDIDPEAIRHILAYTFILEITFPPPSRAREVTFRLSGTRLNALFQRELKNRTFAEVWRPNEVANANAVLDGVLEDRAAIVAGLMGSPIGYDPAGFEMLLLPLRHHGKTHSRVLGSIAASTLPTWIGLNPVDGLQLLSFRHVMQGPAAFDRVSPSGPCVLAQHPHDVPADVAPLGVQVGAFTVYEGGQHRPRRVGFGL